MGLLFQHSQIAAAFVKKRSLEAQCEFGEFFNTAAGHCEYCSIMCRDPKSKICVYYCPTYASVQIASLEAKSREVGSTNSNNNSSSSSSSINSVAVVGCVIAGLVAVVVAVGLSHRFRRPTEHRVVEEEEEEEADSDSLPFEQLAANSREDSTHSENFPLATLSRETHEESRSLLDAAENFPFP